MDTEKKEMKKRNRRMEKRRKELEKCKKKLEQHRRKAEQSKDKEDKARKIKDAEDKARKIKDEESKEQEVEYEADNVQEVEYEVDNVQEIECETTNTQENQGILKERKVKLLIIIICVLVLAGSAVAVIMNWDDIKEQGEEVIHIGRSEIEITVAWNPGSIADTMIRTMADNSGMKISGTKLIIHNLNGAHGASGQNAVYENGHTGNQILASNLSSFCTSELMGFGISSYQEWETWNCAFSPCLMVVASDSPYTSVEQLLADAAKSKEGLKCADAGAGTIGFAAAVLFGNGIGTDFEQVSYSGSTQVVEALSTKEADFAIIQTTEIMSSLFSGDVKALGVFDKKDITLERDGAELEIVSLLGIDKQLDAILPFGEVYGLMIPEGASAETIEQVDLFIKKSIKSDEFKTFLCDNGLSVINETRRESKEYVKWFSTLICWTLYDVGYLPVSPDEKGIERYE